MKVNLQAQEQNLEDEIKSQQKSYNKVSNLKFLINIIFNLIDFGAAAIKRWDDSKETDNNSILDSRDRKKAIRREKSSNICQEFMWLKRQMQRLY